MTTSLDSPDTITITLASPAEADSTLVDEKVEDTSNAQPKETEANESHIIVETEAQLELNKEDVSKEAEVEVEAEPEAETQTKAEIKSEGTTKPELCPFYATATFSTSTSSQGIKRVKIPMLTTGYWYHPQYGDVNITPEYIKQAKKNYEDNVLGFTPYLTYGHIEDIDEAYKGVKTVDASLNKGDIEEVVIENNTLYGICPVSSETCSLIEKGELKFNSPEIISDFVSKRDGKRLGPVIHRTVLTSSPYLAPQKSIEVLSLSQSTEVVEAAEANNCLPKPISVMIRLDPNIETTKFSNMTINTDTENTTIGEEVKTSAPVVEPKVEDSRKEIDIAAIIKAAIDPLTSTWEQQANAMKASYEAAIDELKGQVTSLKSELDVQKTTSYAFSQRISSEERANKNAYLSSKGLSPALIEGFNYVVDSISAKSNVVKFSQVTEAGTEEREVSVVSAIENLLINAAKTGMVDSQRYGQSYSSASSLDDEIRELARKNRELAQKNNK